MAGAGMAISSNMAPRCVQVQPRAAGSAPRKPPLNAHWYQKPFVPASTARPWLVRQPAEKGHGGGRESLSLETLQPAPGCSWWVAHLTGRQGWGRHPAASRRSPAPPGASAPRNLQAQRSKR